MGGGPYWGWGTLGGHPGLCWIPRCWTDLSSMSFAVSFSWTDFSSVSFAVSFSRTDFNSVSFSDSSVWSAFIAFSVFSSWVHRAFLLSRSCLASMAMKKKGETTVHAATLLDGNYMLCSHFSHINWPSLTELCSLLSVLVKSKQANRLTPPKQPNWIIYLFSVYC